MVKRLRVFGHLAEVKNIIRINEYLTNKRMEQGDTEQAQDHDMPEGEEVDMPEKYDEISLKDFAGYSKSMFLYWTEDDFASSFRKMLTLEQFRSEEMQQLYQQYLVSGPSEYVKDLFEHMGISPAKELAAQFYAVMFFFYSMYDGAKDKDEVKKQFETTLDEFTKKLLVGERMTHLFRNLILSWRKTGS